MSNKKLISTSILVFFLSGAASLTYQVVWQRVLTQTVGSDAHSVILIVSIFMLGLGLGGLFGSYVLRLSRTAEIYAFIELLIGLFGFFSIGAIRSLAGWIEPFAPSVAVEFMAYFALLSAPTILMGMTLPMMVHLVRYQFSPGHALGLIYAANIAGAALGTVAAGFVFVPTIGLIQTSRCVAGVNLLIALFAIFGFRRSEAQSVPDLQVGGNAPDQRSYRRLALMAASFIVGFVAIGYEIVFFRIFAAYFGMVSYVFSILLFSYLICLAFGTSRYGGIVSTQRSEFLPLNLLLLTVVSTFVVLIVPELIYLLGLNQERLVLDASAGDPLSWATIKYEIFSFMTPTLRESLGVTWASWGLSDVSGSAVVECAIILGTATLLMAPVVFISAFFPLALQLYSTSRAETGRNAGWLYFVQTGGNLLGAIITGLLLLPYVGTINSLKIIGLLLTIAAVILASAARPARLYRLALSAVAALLVVNFYPASFYSTIRSYYDAYRFGQSEPIRPSIVLENAVGVTLAYPIPGGLWVNTGRERSTSVVKDAGAWELWPMEFVAALKPNARNALIIGMGPGTHLPILERLYPGIHIDVVELNPAVVELVRTHGNAEIQAALARQSVIVTDGRRFALRNPGRRYDIIQIGVNNVAASGAGNLYTQDFLQTLQQMLTPGGVLTTWASAPAVKAAARVFQNIAVASPGSNIGPSAEAARAYKAEGSGARVSHLVAWNNSDAMRFRALLTNAAREIPALMAVDPNSPNITVRPNWLDGCLIFSDLFPRLLAPVTAARDDLPVTEYFLTQRETIDGVSPNLDSRFWGKPSGCTELGRG